MTKYKFKETIKELSKFLIKQPLAEIDEEGMVIEFENCAVTLSPSKNEEGIDIRLPLAMFINVLSERHLEELTNSNYLGIETYGSTFYIDKEGILSLKAYVSPYTPPEAVNEWIIRLLYASNEWIEKLSTWSECLVFVLSLPEVKQEYFKKV